MPRPARPAGRRRRRCVHEADPALVPDRRVVVGRRSGSVVRDGRRPGSDAVQRGLGGYREDDLDLAAREPAGEGQVAAGSRQGAGQEGADRGFPTGPGAGRRQAGGADYARLLGAGGGRRGGPRRQRPRAGGPRGRGGRGPCHARRVQRRAPQPVREDSGGRLLCRRGVHDLRRDCVAGRPADRAADRGADRRHRPGVAGAADRADTQGERLRRYWAWSRTRRGRALARKLGADLALGRRRRGGVRSVHRRARGGCGGSSRPRRPAASRWNAQPRSRGRAVGWSSSARSGWTCRATPSTARNSTSACRCRTGPAATIRTTRSGGAIIPSPHVRFTEQRNMGELPLPGRAGPGHAVGAGHGAAEVRGRARGAYALLAGKAPAPPAAGRSASCCSIPPARARSGRCAVPRAVRSVRLAARSGSGSSAPARSPPVSCCRRWFGCAAPAASG